MQINNYTPEYIRQNADKIDFTAASSIIKIEEFPISIIEDYADDWDWDIFSQFHILSEEIIRRFHYKVNWNLILLHQDLSDEFLIEFKNRFYLEGVSSVIGFKFRLICHNALTLLLFEQNIEFENLKMKLQDTFENFKVSNRVKELDVYKEDIFITCKFKLLSEKGQWSDFKIQTA